MIIRDEPILIEMGKFCDASALTGARLFVSFDVSHMQIAPNQWQQPVTMCVIRCEKPWATGVGFAICHPNDVHNPQMGERVAFRRAVGHFMTQAFPGKNWVEDFWWDVFRKSLYGARVVRRAAITMAVKEAEAEPPVRVSGRFP